MAEDRELDSPPLMQGDETIPRIRLSQISYNGLNVFSGHVYEDCDSALRWPNAIFTYKKMAKDATIAPALSLVEMAIARVPWSIKIPEGYEDQLKDKAEFLRQVMNDMDHSWGHFIRQCVTFNRYGFSVHEKVYRKRYKRNGSKYDDGLVGLESLPLITQDSIESWDWDETGRKLTGLYQYKNKPTGKDKAQYLLVDEDQWIPRKKFLHFRNNALKDDPVGISPLASCYVAWKYKTELEKFEGSGIASDVRGLKVLKLNPRYMAPDASPEDQQVYAYYQNMMRNLHIGEQSGVIIPSLKDENGEEMIADFQLMGINGTKSFDVPAVISRYQKEIITSLMASQLILGQDGGGSFSLAESLQGISDMAIEAKLIEIQEQLNHDLIIQLFQLNGWSTEVTPYFEFGRVSDTDLDVLSKFVQRVASVGLLPRTPDVVNYLTEEMGVTAQFAPDESQEEMDSLLTGNSSRAADGLTTAGEGTSSSPMGGDDASTGNTENA